MNTNNNLSPASRTYLSRAASAKIPASVVDDNKKKKYDSKKIAITLFGLALLGAAGVGFKKYNTVIFENGRALIKGSGKDFSGCLNLKNCKITYENGLLKKSVKTGKDGFVKEYLYDKNNQIQKVIKDGKEIDIAAIREKTKKQIKKVNNLQEELNNKRIKYNTAKNSINTIMGEYRQCDLQIQKYEAELKLDDVQFKNKKLNVKKRKEIEENIKKAKRFKQILFQKIKQEKVINGGGIKGGSSVA